MRKVIAVIGFFVAGAVSVSAAHFTNVPVPVCGESIPRTMSIGARGDDVTVLQSILVSNGYFSATPNA
jgi:hypothetical protein